MVLLKSMGEVPSHQQVAGLLVIIHLKKHIALTFKIINL